MPLVHAVNPTPFVCVCVHVVNALLLALIRHLCAAPQVWREAIERLGVPVAVDTSPRMTAVATAAAMSSFGARAPALATAQWDAALAAAAAFGAGGGSRQGLGVALPSAAAAATEMLGALDGLVGSLEDAGASMLAVRVLHAVPTSVMRQGVELTRLEALVRQVLVKVRFPVLWSQCVCVCVCVCVRACVCSRALGLACCSFLVTLRGPFCPMRGCATSFPADPGRQGRRHLRRGCLHAVPAGAVRL